MKTMTCKALGGACDVTFTANTFDEIAQQSKSHGMSMFEAGDKAHIKAMNEMRATMAEPNGMQAWMAARAAEFKALPED